MKYKIPCKNCITLSICRASLQENSSINDILTLSDKCSTLYAFLYFYRDPKKTPYKEYPGVEPGSQRQLVYNCLEYNISLLKQTLLRGIKFHGRNNDET